MTSLPKLTPVKDVEEGRRAGEEEKGRTQDNKNHERQEAEGWWPNQEPDECEQSFN